MRILYLFELKKVVTIVGLTAFLFVIFTQHSFAAITGAKNTISTSRPSASTPLGAALGTTDTQATVFNNGSRFLASDSAKLIKQNTGQIMDTGTIISSQSAGLTTVYFGEQAGIAGHDAADVLFMPITAMHTVEFKVGTEVPVSGIIRLTFPTLTSGDADNDASPSATTFQFNNLISGGTGPIEVWNVTGATEITSNITFAETEPSAGAAGVITMTLDGSTSIAQDDVVRIFIGCTASSVSSCTTQAPRIINPTKTATLGTADAWKLRIDTRTAADGPLENVIISIATIESVTVRATVDPTLSFTITGLGNGVAVNSGNDDVTYGCQQNESTNSGITATANEINLGILTNTPGIDVKISNISAQRINIETNGPSGYALTATSAGSLLNESTGFFFRASTTPSSFPLGDEFFGLHACGQDVVSGFVETGASSTDCDTHITGSSANECRYAWPSNNQFTSTTPLSISSDTVGPIGTGSPDGTGDGITSISYAASTDVSVPPGEYRSVVTYIATPSF